jgi:hypothetical protein
MMEGISIWLKAIFGTTLNFFDMETQKTPCYNKFVDIRYLLFHVTYAILVGESNERWTWFIERLHDVIGHLSGLVIHKDACKVLENNVYVVFPRIEHRKCMRQLVLTS